MAATALDVAMARYADGDEGAFEAIYDDLSPRLYGFLVRQTGDSALAEDLMQQTFLQLHRSRSAFRPGAAALPWAFAIARRLAIDTARRARFEVRQSDDTIAERAGAEPSPDMMASARQLDSRFQTEFAKLPESQRTAFTMIRHEGLSIAEAASALGTTGSAVKLRAHRAYETLRMVLGDVFDRPEVKR
jgi:RNA polymerase sigma-70 factor (ECF subfamily)